jgi:cytochrome c-type biogenesis protein
MSSLPLPMAAFLAGLISFLSPCVLPLVPGYISMISGVGMQEPQQQDANPRRAVLIHAVMFVTGFSLVFIAFGAVASSIGQLAGRHMSLLSKIAGLIVIVFGFHLVGLVRIRALYADKRFDAPTKRRGPAHAFLVGLAFAFGWTPCVGPILAGILALAASEATLQRGVILLTLYSLGLAAPFLLTSLSIERFLSLYSRFRGQLRKMEVMGGSLMIGVGVLIFTRHLTILNAWLNDIPFVRAMAERFL